MSKSGDSVAELRIGLVGAGQSGAAYALACEKSEACRLTAVCDREPERAAGIPGTKPFRKIDELLSAEEVDAVIVATTASNRAEIALRALQCGLSVLVEGPVSEDAGLAKELAETKATCSKWKGSSGGGKEGGAPSTALTKMEEEVLDLKRGTSRIDLDLKKAEEEHPNHQNHQNQYLQLLYLHQKIHLQKPQELRAGQEVQVGVLEPTQDIGQLLFPEPAFKEFLNVWAGGIDCNR